MDAADVDIVRDPFVFTFRTLWVARGCSYQPDVAERLQKANLAYAGRPPGHSLLDQYLCHIESLATVVQCERRASKSADQDY